MEEKKFFSLDRFTFCLFFTGIILVIFLLIVGVTKNFDINAVFIALMTFVLLGSSYMFLSIKQLYSGVFPITVKKDEQDKKELTEEEIAIKKIESLLIYIMKTKIIDDIVDDSYNLTLKFTDKTKMYFWKANKYYSYCHDGYYVGKDSQKIEWNLGQSSIDYDILEQFDNWIINTVKNIKEFETTSFTWKRQVPEKIINKESEYKIK